MTFSVISAAIEWLEKHQEAVLTAEQDAIDERKRIEEEIANVSTLSYLPDAIDTCRFDIAEKARRHESDGRELYEMEARVFRQKACQ